ncbi:MAG: type II secretion system GspH family protein [Candidatus Omnitrophica bacterium]|nr:type II secretion system GspH family protein [Candidatus Omnitrophota bacterium]
MKYKIKKTNYGFTLIELLIVIGIIAVLSSMLLPGLNKAREKAKQITCVNNLRQIGIAFTLYLSDYGDFFPSADDPINTSPTYWLWMGRGWRKLLTPYINSSISSSNPSVLLCPSDKTAPINWESTSYAYSLSFYHSPEQINLMNDKSFTYDTSKIVPTIPQKLSSVKHPDKKILIGEWLDNHTGGKNNWWSWGGSRNYLFVDGHAEFLKATQILPANDNYPDINLTKDGIRGKDIN